MDPTATPSMWWGRFEVEEGEARRWTVGPCRVLVERRHHEWRVSHWEATDDGQLEGGAPVEPEAAPGATLHRLASESTHSSIGVLPATADRSVVARPETGLEILPEEAVTLFVGSPAWVRIEAGSQGRLLAEFPAVRPPDTWFGPSTTEGELAYASRTVARLEFDHLTSRPYRILTRLLIQNLSPTNLRIERIALPAPTLSVFEDSVGRLWTEDVSVVVSKDEAEASVKVLRGEPREAGRVTVVAGPRREDGPNMLVRAMSALGI